MLPSSLLQYEKQASVVLSYYQYLSCLLWCKSLCNARHSLHGNAGVPLVGFVTEQYVFLVGTSILHIAPVFSFITLIVIAATVNDLLKPFAR